MRQGPRLISSLSQVVSTRLAQVRWPCLQVREGDWEEGQRDEEKQEPLFTNN